MVKRYRKKDPYRAKEARKYAIPVPSREFILGYMKHADKPMSFPDLREAFELKLPEEHEGLRRRLIAMTRDGQLFVNRRGYYGPIEQMELIAGRIQCHRDGFGFLVPDDADADIFLPAKELRGLFSHDRVLVRLTGRDYMKRQAGLVVDVLERNTEQVIGRFYDESGVTYVAVDDRLCNQPVIIPEDRRAEAKTGQFVLVSILPPKRLRQQPTGAVLKILGDHLEPTMAVDLAIVNHNLPNRWEKAVTVQASQYKKRLTEHDLVGRKDFRHLPFVTIDGEDAKDFDDAVFCEAMNTGWRLLVAIADVSHYVEANSPMDIEASVRGNSVYFPNRVVPMLPEMLSNGICSLLPHFDRLVLVCEMRLDRAGNVTSYKYYKGVIHSHARLTYHQVTQMLAGDESFGHKRLLPYLKHFKKVYHLLNKLRQGRGAIDFDTTETQVQFNESGRIDQILPQTRTIAHRMIEEAMLLANEVTAKYLLQHKIPVLYRVHECPSPQKLEMLRDFLKPFGLRLTGGDSPATADFSRLLLRIKKRKDAHLLQTVLLRSLSQAVYSPEPKAHFGLAYEPYCHFTSPIRRFPDLITHRAIKHLLKQRTKSRFSYTPAKLEVLGEHCSMTERRADRASREALDWLKCDYMLDKVGQTFEGVIADVTSFGVFVELADVYIQGLVHVSQLPEDYYHFDDVFHRLVGRANGKTYQLGDTLRVIVARVDLDERQIDFEPV